MVFLSLCLTWILMVLGIVYRNAPTPSALKSEVLYCLRRSVQIEIYHLFKDEV